MDGAGYLVEAQGDLQMWGSGGIYHRKDGHICGAELGNDTTAAGQPRITG
jgi:hypothetical protein